MGDSLRYAIALIDLCDSFLDLNTPDSTMKYRALAYEIVKDRHPLGLAYLTQRIVQAHVALGQYEEALKYFKESEAQSEKHNQLLLIVRNHEFLAECYLLMGKKDEALYQILRAERLSRDLGIHEDHGASAEIGLENIPRAGWVQRSF